MLGAFVAGPGISRVTGGWWKDYQNWRAARQAAQQRAAARQAFISSYQAALQFSAPSGQVVYDEDPLRATKLVQEGSDFARISAPEYIYFPPQPWQLPVVRRFRGQGASMRVSPRGATVFLHSRKAPDGTERLVWVDFIADESMRQTSANDDQRYFHITNRRLFATHAYAAGTDEAVHETTQRRLSILQPEARNPFVVWKKGPSWENGTIEPHLRDVFRIFAAQPDAKDPSHFTISYELDGRPGIIDGWLRNDLTVVLDPRQGRVVRQDDTGFDREWNPYADQPATRPTDPALIVPPFVPRR
jgi:hypothetical protein